MRRYGSTSPRPGTVTLIGPATFVGTVRSSRERRRQEAAEQSTPYNEALGATLIERSDPGADRARRRDAPAGADDDDTEASLDELALLVDTAGADGSAGVVQRRDAPDHTWFIGKGKAEELRELCLAVDADTVVFDNELTPGAAVQPGEAARPHGHRPHRGDPRHLRPERPHARRARPRSSWPCCATGCPGCAAARRRELSQQGGGVGTRFGPGETKLEVDRRRIMRRITKLEAELAATVGAPRTLQRKSRGAQRPRQRRPSSATPTPASRRCSTASPTPACSSRTACSPRSTRRRAGWRCPVASRCCSPTRSASSAACPTGWSRRSRARSRSPAEADLPRPRRRRQRARPRGADRRRPV